MQGNGGGRDPFMDFGGSFGGFSGFSGFGSQRSLISNFFGGRNPFDDPFFTQPFGGMLGSNFFDHMPSPFMNMHRAGFIENHPPQPKRSKGPIIEELNSEDEQEADREREGNPRKLARSRDDPRVEVPAEETEGRSRSRIQSWVGGRSRQGISRPRGHSFSFQSSAVTFGGANGAYYTSSTTRTGSDGVTFEESKKADSSTMQASHRISRGLHNKGHSMTRKLNSDGGIEAMETLHNLHQDELAVFNEAWKGNAKMHLPGWSDLSSGYDNHGASGGRGARALPSTEHSSPKMALQGSDAAGPSSRQPSRKTKAEASANGGRSRGRPRGQ